MNKVCITGNLTKNPEAFTTQGGVSRSTFTVAVNRPFKDKDGNRVADFLTVVAWRGAADYCNQYLQKGRKVAVEGSIQTRSYDAQDGSKRYVTEIIAEHVETLDRSPEAQNNAPVNNQSRAQASQDDRFVEVDDSELPF